MSDENLTLIGFNSKKQPYYCLVVSIVIFVTAIFWFFFAEGDKKYASIGLAVIAALFLAGFFSLRKQPKIALKVFDDRYLCFYSSDGEKRIDVQQVKRVSYWPAQAGLKITFVTDEGKEHFSYLLENADIVKSHLLDIFKRNNIFVIKRYSS